MGENQAMEKLRLHSGMEKQSGNLQLPERGRRAFSTQDLTKDLEKGIIMQFDDAFWSWNSNLEELLNKELVFGCKLPASTLISYSGQDLCIWGPNLYIVRKEVLDYRWQVETASYDQRQGLSDPNNGPDDLELEVVDAVQCLARMLLISIPQLIALAQHRSCKVTREFWVTIAQSSSTRNVVTAVPLRFFSFYELDKVKPAVLAFASISACFVPVL
ncbi:hypothetical protein BKA70DRAFT_1220671 [Coprinopsis sp. MPI-PUGE-AT-0042]|nr:hypothetical protein BKA70DRAFT_1220671 [Coprinopsis sp. MPI-PUGE-AT-0042]